MGFYVQQTVFPHISGTSGHMAKRMVSLKTSHVTSQNWGTNSKFEGVTCKCLQDQLEETQYKWHP